MATVTKDLGIATAYGYAKSKGYTGTEDEFAQAMFDITTAVDDAQQYAQDAEDAKDDAQASAQSIEQSAQQIATNTSDIADLKEDLTDMSSEGIVPTARQLLSDKYAVDEEPYKFRASFAGDRMDDEIVGGSIVWNQFADINSRTMFGISVSRVSESTIRVTGTISSIDFGYIDNHGGAMAFQTTHVYIVWVNGPSSASSYLKFHQGSKATPDILNSPSIFKYAGGTSGNCIETTATGDVDYTFHWNKIDLTKMFGAEVADYIYGLEQTNAGAGVAWFRKLFPKDYYEYNAGELMHVEGVSVHEMVGFNLWDEEWESGIYNPNTGLPMSDPNYIRSKNKIEILSGASYYVKKPVGAGFRIVYYGTSDSFISNEVVADSWTGKNITIPPNTRYIRIYCGNKTYNHDICVNISDPSRNGTYEPYVKHTYPLDDSLTLRGIPKVGSNGLYFDGDRYKADGTVERRYGIVDLGTLNWAYVGSATYPRFYSLALARTAKPSADSYTLANIICDRWKNATIADGLNGRVTDCISLYGNANNATIAIHTNAYTDDAAFKAAMSGVMLVYELATPTTETAQPYTALQTVDASGTEEYVSTSIVPVGHYTKYYDDLRKKLDSLPWNLGMIAPIETGTTASQAYAVGKYFLLDHQLCKAKTAIASGATFTLNTNYEVTTVADELYTALNS